MHMPAAADRLLGLGSGSRDEPSDELLHEDPVSDRGSAGSGEFSSTSHAKAISSRAVRVGNPDADVCGHGTEYGAPPTWTAASANSRDLI